MSRVVFKSVPARKEDITLALESGVDGVIVPRADVAAVAALARCEVLAAEDMQFTLLTCKADEEQALQELLDGKPVVLSRGWEVIPVENLLARSNKVAVEAGTTAEARLAAGILQCGVECVVVLPEAVAELKAIVAELKVAQGTRPLQKAVITKVQSAGLGHRVCVDTLSLLHRGQGMLVGNSSAFAFLVHAETEHNEYVAARPFRVNAGAVHAYGHLPHDRTCYLGELQAGQEVLIVDSNGNASVAVVGRAKVEVRPMLLIEAKVGDTVGAVFLQNAETIRLVAPDGTPRSVVTLKEGDEVLCHLDSAGRHFGMRISEDIQEV